MSDMGPNYNQYLPQTIPKAPPNPDFFSGDTYKTMKSLMPSYQSIRNPDGSLKTGFNLTGGPDVGFTSNLDSLNSRLAGINLNTDALNSLRGEGLRSPGTLSAWGQMATNTAKGAAMQQEKGQQAGAFSALASRGGINKGARERIATRGARDGLMAQQKAGNDIAMQDESNRLDILKGLPGMEVQALQPELQKTDMWGQLANTEAARKQGLDLANRDYSTGVNKYNIGNKLADQQGSQAFDMNKYSEIMKAWAADRTANAQENSGK